MSTPRPSPPCPPEERFILLGMHQTLVERGLYLREHTELGRLLVFPSYYQHEHHPLDERE